MEAIEQINQGLNQVSSVVQTNAATAEESSASSEELDTQAQVLKQEVERFRLQGECTQQVEEPVLYEAAATAELQEDTGFQEYTAQKEETVLPVSYIHDSAKY